MKQPLEKLQQIIENLQQENQILKEENAYLVSAQKVLSGVIARSETTKQSLYSRR